VGYGVRVPDHDFRLHPPDARLLEGRRALVTGASSGIGQGTAFELAAHGAAVAINHRGKVDHARAMVAAIETAGGRAVPVEMDIAVEADVQRGFAEAREAFGGLDLLVNNAGVEKPFHLVDMPLEEWEKVISVNLTGTFLCTREAARIMRSDGTEGAIVMISSVHEVIPWEQFSHYCASKGGMKLFAQSVAKELAPHGIRVVSIHPTGVDTPLNDGLAAMEGKTPQEIAEASAGNLLPVPWVEASDVAEAVRWLVSDSARFVTGSQFVLDAGLLTR
jgi:glucose 1-dehydrogenase